MNNFLSNALNKGKDYMKKQPWIAGAAIVGALFLFATHPFLTLLLAVGAAMYFFSRSSEGGNNGK